MQAKDPTIAELLKPLGYATGQFGKNHLGDRDEYLPTVHGFDEFFGNLYHLNAEEEPENPDYPKDPEFKERFGPRGVHPLAGRKPRGQAADRGHGAAHQEADGDGRRRVPRRGARLHRQGAQGRASRSSSGSTRRACTSGRTSSRSAEGKTGLGIYADGMVEHDGRSGELLEKLDELGIADNTIVMYSTDNGAETFTWPDGGTTPFRGEKNTNWEGGYRVPALIRWPGVIKPGTISNDIVAHEDWLPTLLAAAGVPDVKEELLQGKQVGDRTYKVHLDGYDLLPLLKGEARSAAQGVLLLDRRRRARGAALRPLEARLRRAARPGLRRLAGAVRGAARCRSSSTCARSLRAGRHDSIDYHDWRIDRAFLLVPAQAYARSGCRASRNSRRGRRRRASASTR